MKQFIIVLSILFVGFSAFAQDDDIGGKFGANKTHFVHSHLSLGFMMPLPEGEGMDLLYGKSHSITYGVRYKLRIADFFALGAGLNYTYNVWHIDQNDSKSIPSNILFDKEKIYSNNLGGDAYIRFNVGKRTNTIGNFIDLGGYGEWAYGRLWKTTINNDDTENPLFSEFTTTTSHKLDWLEKINYGLSARIGYGKFVIFGKYRLSDVFTKDFKEDLATDVEFPRLIIGFEIGFHK